MPLANLTTKQVINCLKDTFIKFSEKTPNSQIISMREAFNSSPNRAFLFISNFIYTGTAALDNLQKEHSIVSERLFFDMGIDPIATYKLAMIEGMKHICDARGIV